MKKRIIFLALCLGILGEVSLQAVEKQPTESAAVVTEDDLDFFDELEVLPLPIEEEHWSTVYARNMGLRLFLWGDKLYSKAVACYTSFPSLFWVTK